MKTLIIIPAYNEEESIFKLLNEIKNCEVDLDIVVVNDGSKDNTVKEAKKVKDVIVLDLPVNLGIGGAVQTGYLYAYKNNYDVAIQIDGDGQHDPKYIKEILKYIEEGNDMIIASRFVEKTNYNQTFMRMFGNKIISVIINLFSGVKIYDTTSGFRIVNKSIIEKFANSYPYDYPEPDTNLQVILSGKKILEVPVEMRKRETGESFVSPIKSIQYMVKVILSLFLVKLRKNG